MDELVRELIQRRSQHCFPLGVQTTARDIAKQVLALLFPHFSETQRCDSSEVAGEMASLRANLVGLLESLSRVVKIPAEEIIDRFLESLPGLYNSLILDARAIEYGDPAATGVDEVILTYPGFYAIAIHRVAHVLHELKYPLLPRLLSEHAHERTGIDIHPGAQIGRSFFIDHGTGVVIGETTEIGNGVKIYQGVTLGALAVAKALSNRKRHPTIEDNVVIYANATVLGGETIIGQESVIGANAWISETVPPFSIVGRHSDVRPRKPNSEPDLEFYI